jgi:type IV pilus assembly protein PilW
MRRIIAFARNVSPGVAAVGSVRPARRSRLRAASLVDAMVGLAVAMLALVIVYHAFVATDALRRNAAAAADAHGSAAFALFTLAAQITGAGAGWASAARWLDTCPVIADVATTLRPVAVLITEGGGASRPDSLVVRQTFARRLALPAAVAAAADAGTHVRAQSPDGFMAGDRIVAVTRTGNCVTTEVSAVAAPSAGIVDVTHTGVAIDLPITTVLLDLGAASRASTLRFDLVSEALRSQDVANGDAPVPLTSNVVNLKFQYGIDSDGDGALDTWARADAASSWSPEALLAAPRATLERIKAIRVGIIVRAERIDRTLARDFHWVLFDCEQDDKAACPGRLEGTIPGSATGSYRYRVLETVIPLRNVMWNRSG